MKDTKMAFSYFDKFEQSQGYFYCGREMWKELCVVSGTWWIKINWRWANCFSSFYQPSQCIVKLKMHQESTCINSSKWFAIQLELKQWQDNKKTLYYREAFEVSLESP